MRWTRRRFGKLFLIWRLIWNLRVQFRSINVHLYSNTCVSWLMFLFLPGRCMYEYRINTIIEPVGKTDREVALLSWKEISKMIWDWSGKRNVLNNVVLKYLKYKIQRDWLLITKIISVFTSYNVLFLCVIDIFIHWCSLEHIELHYRKLFFYTGLYMSLQQSKIQQTLQFDLYWLKIEIEFAKEFFH